MLTKNENIDSVMESVVREYIHSASPVSSQKIVDKYQLKVSPATVRNIMNRLEEAGLLTQPHTSAGRIPTNAGYRYYIDTLLKGKKLSPNRRDKLDMILEGAPGDLEYLLDLTARLLGKYSDELGIALSPLFLEAVLEKVEIVELSNDRYLLVLEMEGGMVKTLMVESSKILEKRHLPRLAGFLNEQMLRKSLSQIIELLEQFFDYSDAGDYHLVHQISLGLQSAMTPRLFASDSLSFISRHNEDWGDNIDMRQLIKNDSWIWKLRNHAAGQNSPVQIVFGDELDFPYGSNCAAIFHEYHIGRLKGFLAVFGPSHMDYSRIIPLVGYLSKTLSRKIYNNRKDY
ncbi:MAG TPA: heat-inducible transcription repressor HrcA [Candidatus Marinimicrobia bacterium]|nr:heat-inducible transcription repressor HrcA [Candidatus Neomarinimicrobiota bacterium]